MTDDIELTTALSTIEIRQRLSARGLMLEMSQADDSTYGQWHVLPSGEKYGNHFDSLTSIIKHYKL